MEFSMKNAELIISIQYRMKAIAQRQTVIPTERKDGQGINQP